MKRFIPFVTILIMLCGLNSAMASEKLNYVVTYKWGLIHKDAGEVEITRQPKGNGYELKLVAKTKPWADRIFKVRDTLISVTSKEKYRPESYTYIAHEKNRYKRDNLRFSYSGNKVRATGDKYREKKDGRIKTGTIDLEGGAPAYDMLSVYFFLRDIDFASLKPGETINANIFSGDKVEQLKVRCEGIEKVKLRDKSEREAWHVLFNFTQEGGKKSSDDINCWISTDSSKIPLLIIGTLPVGQIRVNYVP